MIGSKMLERQLWDRKIRNCQRNEVETQALFNLICDVMDKREWTLDELNQLNGDIAISDSTVKEFLSREWVLG